ncbi:hypothetical protein [Halorubellus litoreus]|uniref:Major facilitator superfamily (MFS) profile domain-containing protein n=1 Tax=Halorubellus litoreus TaxID=755308 RepID=A0ABD5VH70_9EURY
MGIGLLQYERLEGRVVLGLWVVGLLALAVVLSATLRSIGSVLLLGVGPLAVVSAVLAQLAGVSTISRYRTLFVGLVAAFFAVLLGTLSLVTGTGVFALLGFGASMLAGVAAVVA